MIASFTATGYQPVAPDLLGCGSRPPIDAMDFDMLAADMATDERDHLPIAPVTCSAA